MAPHGVFRGGRRGSLARRRRSRTTPRGAASRRSSDARSWPDDARFATLVARKRHEDELEALVTAWTRDAGRRGGGRHARRRPVSPPSSRRRTATSPRIRTWRRAASTSRLEHPEVGELMHLGIPWRMSESDSRVRRAAPCLGQDTDDVLRDVCGYAAEDDRAPARRGRPRLDPRSVSSIAASSCGVRKPSRTSAGSMSRCRGR